MLKYVVFFLMVIRSITFITQEMHKEQLILNSQVNMNQIHHQQNQNQKRYQQQHKLTVFINNGNNNTSVTKNVMGDVMFEDSKFNHLELLNDNETQVNVNEDNIKLPYDNQTIIANAQNDKKQTVKPQQDKIIVGLPTPHRVHEILQYYDHSIRREQIDPDDLRIASIYWDVNLDRPVEYWEPNNLIYSDGNPLNYEIGEEIGNGSYSSVYLSKDLRDGKQVIMKVLKESNQQSINREIQILQALSGSSEYIVELVDALRFRNESKANLVFSYMNGTTIDIRAYRNEYNLTSITQQMYQLLQALNTSHYMGVMHRDIKLQNIIVDDQNNKLRLIDWGVSEFYHPLKEYSTIAGTRHFRAPELLIHYRYYDYSIDVWAAGCVLGEMISKHHPIFSGKDNDDQLTKVVEILGSQQLIEYIDKYNITIQDPHLLQQVNQYRKQSIFYITNIKRQIIQPKGLESIIHGYNKNTMIPLALDLLKKIFVYDHKQRYTAQQALQHPFFNSINN